jgi:hypothetical protein
MAEKHKSKYKKPENKKPTYRKDLKDYTLDDKKGGLNPKTTGEKQTNVLRKTDKKMQDDGKMYPSYNDDDRLYKDLESGEYDPKTAAKRLKKRQDTEEKETADVLQDKIENLTREQKERIVREYVRRKIVNILKEQPTPPDAPEEEPADAPADAPAPGAPDLTGTQPTDTPAPGAPTPPADAPAPGGAPAPAPGGAPAPAEPAAPAPDAGKEEAPADAEKETEKKLDPEAQEALAIQKFVDHLREKETGNIARLKTISKVINMVLKDSEPEDFKNFFGMLKSLAIKKLQQGNPKKDEK